MKVEIKGNKLFIELDIDKHPSKSGKTTVVASLHGNQATSAIVADQPVVVGVNAYIRKQV